MVSDHFPQDSLAFESFLWQDHSELLARAACRNRGRQDFRGGTALSDLQSTAKGQVTGSSSGPAGSQGVQRAAEAEITCFSHRCQKIEAKLQSEVSSSG